MTVIRRQPNPVRGPDRWGPAADTGQSPVNNLSRPRWLAGAVELCACLVVGFAAAVASAGAEAEADSALDQALQTLAGLAPGQDLQVLNPIGQAVTQSQTDEQVRAHIEARLVAILQGDATDLAKQYACRQLALVGSDAAVPVLARWLPEPRLAYMARYALEGIGGPTAMASLREALGATAGRQRVGVVISLGRLADAGAVAAISSLLDEDDDALREVAVVALGRIGTTDAAIALNKATGRVPRVLTEVLVDAQLHAAERLCQQGHSETAAQILASLASRESEEVRAAAFRGLISAKTAGSVAAIIAGLSAAEPWKRAVAADCLLELKTPEDVATVASALPNLPTAGRIAALVGLKDRSDPAVREAALKSLDQPDPEIQIAALTALIASAATHDVALLAHRASTAADPRVRDAAFETLRLMSARGTNQAIHALMAADKCADPVIVRCALARRAAEFVPAFLEAAESSHEAVRLAAFEALEVMATAKEAEAIAGLLCETSPGAEREAASRAVWTSCQEIADPAQRPAPLLAALAKANPAQQCAILPALARFGGERALEAVHAAMQDTDQALRDAGYRALANWPDAAVANELLHIAQTSTVESYRVWSLRAYARVVSLPNPRPPEKTCEMLSSALQWATRAQDRELIISRLGSVRSPDALSLLLSLVDNPELQRAAVPAVFTLAKGLSQSHPEQATAALETIRARTNDQAILQQIPKVLRDIKTREER